MIDGLRVTEKLSEEIKKLREENTRLKAQLEHMTKDRDRYKTLCVIDELTGILNIRGLAWEFRRFLARTRRECRNQQVEIYFFVIDVNNFKPLNDRFGHSAGDEAIQVIAKALRESVRQDEITARTAQTARTGGDEFLLIVSTENTNNLPENQNLENTLLKRILETIWTVEKERKLPPISLSIGVSRLSSGFDDSEPETILAKYRKIADRHMYKAKKHYRERDTLLTHSVLSGNQGVSIFYRGGVIITLSLDE